MASLPWSARSRAIWLTDLLTTRTGMDAIGVAHRLHAQTPRQMDSYQRSLTDTRLDRLGHGRSVRVQTNARPPWAISGPLAPVNSGQLRSSGNNEPPSSAMVTASRHTPSKLVMRVRFPSPALPSPALLSTILSPSFECLFD
jgi:hypothetical protein